VSFWPIYRLTIGGIRVGWSMKLFNWKSGRQKATQSLQKLLLWEGKTWDCFLLKIPKSTIHWHFDKVENKEHHRFNLTLWGLWRFWRKNSSGTESFVWQFPIHYHIFRPDIEEHSAEVFKNSLILSIGWVK
jgi:hypothetical protein